MADDHTDHPVRVHIKDWPVDERPREKLFRLGAELLSDAELLSILLRVGQSGKSAEDIGRDLLERYGGVSGIDRAHIEDLVQVFGLGIAKAAQLKAAIEIGKRVRIHDACPRTFDASADVAEYCRPRFEGRRHECFLALLLDGQNRLIAERFIAEGTPTQATVYVRRIMEEALRVSASSLVVVHNHPSGNSAPSPADDDTTTSIHRAADVLNLVFLDHIILGNDDYYSYADHERIENPTDGD
jgi:DNA repair protein RadC